MSDFANPWTVAHRLLCPWNSPGKNPGEPFQEWVAIPFSRESSWPRNQNRVSYIAGRFFTIWATRETPGDTVNNCVEKIIYFLVCLSSDTWWPKLLNMTHKLISMTSLLEGSAQQVFLGGFSSYILQSRKQTERINWLCSPRKSFQFLCGCS